MHVWYELGRIKLGGGLPGIGLLGIDVGGDGRDGGGNGGGGVSQSKKQIK